MKLPDLEMQTNSELVRGEPMRFYNKYMIPIFKYDIFIIKRSQSMIWAEVNPKGFILVEKKRSWYIPIDKERIGVTVLVKKIPRMRKLLNELKKRL